RERGGTKWGRQANRCERPRREEQLRVPGSAGHVTTRPPDPQTTGTAGWAGHDTRLLRAPRAPHTHEETEAWKPRRASSRGDVPGGGWEIGTAARVRTSNGKEATHGIDASGREGAE